MNTESTNPQQVPANSSPDTTGSSAEQGLHKNGTAQIKKYKVTIAGESYFLVSDEPEERVKAVAQLVDTRMKKLAQLSRSDDSKRIATLVALQCASTMVASEELVEKYQTNAEKLIDSITETLSHFSI